VYIRQHYRADAILICLIKIEEKGLPFLPMKSDDVRIGNGAGGGNPLTYFNGHSRDRECKQDITSWVPGTLNIHPTDLP